MNKPVNVIFYLSCFMVLLLLGYDIYLLNIYATDIPFWDIWDLLPTGNYRHLFDFYNENMQVFYFIISETMYRLADWNLRYFVFVNYAVYLALMAIYWKILTSVENVKNLPYYPLFLMILLTPMLGFNWLWIVLVQTHTFILFFLLAIYFGFTKDDKSYSVHACATCLFLSMISMNIPLTVGGVIAYIIKEAVNVKQNGIKKCLLKCGNLVVELGILIILLSQLTDINKFIAVHLRNSVFSLEYINNLSFYLINLYGDLALTEIITPKIALALMPLHFGILLFVFFEQYKNKNIQSLWGIMFGVIFCVSGIIAFRGGEVYSNKFSFIRHNETAFMLVPATLAVLAVSKYKLARYYGIMLVLLVLYGVSADISAKRFQFFGDLFYKNGCVCVNHYYNLKTISDWQCTMNYPVAKPDAIEKAEKMNLSFIKTIKNCK